MLTASAVAANAAHPAAGEGASSAERGGREDGFSTALASLMNLPGQAPVQTATPTPSPPPPPPPSTSVQGAGPAGFSVPAPGGATPTAGSSGRGSASSSKNADGSGAATDATAQGAASAGVSQSSDATASDAAAATADAATTAGVDASVLAAAAQVATAQAATTQATAAQTVTTSGAPQAGAATTAAGLLDPRLVRFIAKAGDSAATATASSTDAQDAATTDAGAGTTAAGADGAPADTDAGSAADDASVGGASLLDTSAANLIVFQASAQANPLTTTQPTLAKGKGAATASQTPAVGAAITLAAQSDLLPVRALPPGADAAASAAAFAAAVDEASSDQTSAGGGGGGQNAGDGSGAAQTPFPMLTPTPLTLAAATPSPVDASFAASYGASVTAQVAAQISNRAGAGSSAFDFALEPAGLGRVDVSLKIDPQGQLSAVFSFDNPNVAADAKARAGDLQQALQQAGFDVSQSGLSFTSGDQGNGAAWQGQAQTRFGGSAMFADAVPDVAPSIIPTTAASRAGGLDIVI